MSIHASDPFATPDDARSVIRQLRGRLPAAVTLLTATGADDRPAGLTVSSLLIADGDPGRVLAVVDEESDFYAAAQLSGRFVLCLLQTSDRRIADIFAGIMPAPGGPFQDGWEPTPYGPRLVGDRTWAGCLVDDSTAFGYGQLLSGTLEAVYPGPREMPLIHYRGRYAEGPGFGAGTTG